MEKLNIALATIIGLVIGAMATALLYGAVVECEDCPICPECPAINLTCPAVDSVCPDCECITCYTEDEAEDIADNYEDETGTRVFSLKSSRDCEDFLENGYLRDDKVIISYADLEDVCKLYYVLE